MQNTNQNIIQSTLASFKIDVEMLKVVNGASLVEYTFKPKQGVNLSKIKRLQDNLALALGAKSLTMNLPVSGEQFCSIEIDNPVKTIINIGDLLQSKEYLESKEILTVNLGQTVSGENIVFSLAKAPHMLVAGTTGSGKSVYINSILYSLISKYDSQDLALILIDMKRTDLTPYNGLPHLLTPVITDVDSAVNALYWLKSHMNIRQIFLQKRGFSNIANYNQAMKEKGLNGLPYIVLVIDELAELVAEANGRIDKALNSLAAMARATGIHLIFGIQRPDTDILKGNVKSNTPTRICFSVPSQIDSRVILDVGGAEHLMGNGDGLAKLQGNAKPVRFQGAFVSESEIKSLVLRKSLELQPSNLDRDLQTTWRDLSKSPVKSRA